MKVYALKGRFGSKVTSSRSPGQKPIPRNEPVEAVVGFPGFDWGEWSLKPFQERVIWWNFWVSYALDTLGLSGPKVHAFLQYQLNRQILLEATATGWAWAGLIAAYAAVVFVLVYFAPDMVDIRWDAVAPFRYLLRYESRVWAGDLRGITLEGRPVYKICYEIGDIIIGEDRARQTFFGFGDLWDTGGLWQQRRDRLAWHELWTWDHATAEYIGMTDRVGVIDFLLQDGFIDPHIAELPAGYEVPDYIVCQQWDPKYQMP